MLICIKGYQSVIHQLEEWGITDYSIFDPNRVYPRKQQRVVIPQVQAAEGAAENRFGIEGEEISYRLYCQGV